MDYDIQSVKYRKDIGPEMPSPLGCLSIKPEQAANGGRNPFVLTARRFDWVCYVLGKPELLL